MAEDMATATGQTLQAMAERVRDWQMARGMKEAELLRRFPGLGTSRTFLRARKGDVGEIDLERWERDYRGVLHVIDAISAGETLETEIFDDLSTVAAVRVALVGAMQQAGNSRLVLVEGCSGSGKSSALRAMQERFGARRVVLTEATDLWRNGKTATSAMLGDILRALGVSDAPASSTQKLEKCVDTLNQTRVCLGIDEAHHCGPTALNLLKTLVNRTPGEFLLGAMGTLWRRLETQTYEEARQLTQNRLYERVRLAAAAREDVEALLTRRLPSMSCDRQAASRAVADAAANRGGLKFVAKVAAAAKTLAAEDGAVDMETIGKAIVQVQVRS